MFSNYCVNLKVKFICECILQVLGLVGRKISSSLLVFEYYLFFNYIIIRLGIIIFIFIIIVQSILEFWIYNVMREF